MLLGVEEKEQQSRAVGIYWLLFPCSVEVFLDQKADADKEVEVGQESCPSPSH